MRNFLAICRRELAATFLSPVAYVTMLVFLALSGLIFWYAVVTGVGTGEPLPTMLFGGVVFCVTILVTVVSMRLFAEEIRLGSLEALMTAPVTESQVVAGKYAGAFLFLLLTVTLPVGFPFILRAMSPGVASLDYGALLGGYLITVLFAAFALATGLLISLLTRNQIVAAIACFCVVWLALLLGNVAAMAAPGPAEVARYLSAVDHVLAFSRGSVDTRPIALYLSGTAFMLFAAVRVLEALRR